MAIKEKYSLRFSKIRNNDNSIFYSCDGNTNIEGSIILSHLLQTASNNEAETLLEEIEHAIVGTNDEEDYLFDQNSSTWIEFSANNAIVYDVITTDKNGNATTKYLPYGVYHVKETKTPNDYTPAPDFTITISKNYTSYPSAEQIKKINVNNT
ncbi:prealbumin-like fold domain-containing protein, partial [Algoriella sp.]|uniref:prealbumin-like fold domain-containing protein n=1 Tax=Algoriella sp. TaxID=1872434 RepID=UPI002FCC233A